MKKLYLLVACLVVFSLVLAGLGACAAPTTLSPSTTSKPTTPGTAGAVSFAGKTVTIVGATAAGGGSDLAARVFARFLGRFLPGNPNVIVRAMPGGEGIIGANYAYSSKPDGLTLLVMGPTVAMADLLDKPAVKFASFTEMTGVALPPSSSSMYMFKSGLFDKPENVTKAKGIIYGMSPNFGGYSFLCMKELIGIPTEKVITSYTGGSDARRAFLAGEITGTTHGGVEWEAEVKPYIDKGEVTLLCQNGQLDQSGNIVRQYNFPPDLLTVEELYTKIYGKAPSGLPWETYQSLHGALKGMDKLLVLPPGTPDSIKKVYWAAGENMLKEPELAKLSDALGYVGKWTAGENVDKTFKRIFAMKPECRDWLKDLVQTKYNMVLQ